METFLSQTLGNRQAYSSGTNYNHTLMSHFFACEKQTRLRFQMRWLICSTFVHFPPAGAISCLALLELYIILCVLHLMAILVRTNIGPKKWLVMHCSIPAASDNEGFNQALQKKTVSNAFMEVIISQPNVLGSRKRANHSFRVTKPDSVFLPFKNSKGPHQGTWGWLYSWEEGHYFSTLQTASGLSQKLRLFWRLQTSSMATKDAIVATIVPQVLYQCQPANGKGKPIVVLVHGMYDYDSEDTANTHIDQFCSEGSFSINNLLSAVPDMSCYILKLALGGDFTQELTNMDLEAHTLLQALYILNESLEAGKPVLQFCSCIL